MDCGFCFEIYFLFIADMKSVPSCYFRDKLPFFSQRGVVSAQSKVPIFLTRGSHINSDVGFRSVSQG